MVYMASMNGITGPVCETIEEAAAAFASKHPLQRKFTVRGGVEEAGVFITRFRDGVVNYRAARKGEAGPVAI